MTDHDTVLFRGDNQRAIRLRVNGYSWADSEDTADLLSMTVRVEDAPFYGGLTVDADIEALDRFNHLLASLLQNGEGIAYLETWEKDFKLNITQDSWGQVEIAATLNALEYVVEGARVTSVLASTIFTHPKAIEDCVAQLQAVLEAFPGRHKHATAPVGA